MTDEATITGATPEDRIVMQVEEYVLAGRGQKHSLTMGTRRVVKALRLIGLERSDFQARTDVRRSGEYGQAYGHIYAYAGCAVVIANAQLLLRCGLDVHVLSTDPGRESAFVCTPHPGQAARLVRYATVSSKA